MIGIYKLTNLITGKIYIGQSVNIDARIRSHFIAANNQKSKDYNTAIHRAIRKYGKSNFQIDILEKCNKDNLNRREKYWINKLDSYKKGYNETPGGEGVCLEGESHPRHIATESDVRDIRKRYNNHERKNEVYKLYSNKISKSGFHKIWNGYVWKNVMAEVYTKENVFFHKHNTGNSGENNGRTSLTNEDVENIRKKYAEGISSQIIYKDYKDKIKYKSFINIICNQNWKNVHKC